MKKENEGKTLIFVSYITVKGKRLYAWQYGYKAWPIWVKA